MTGKKDDGKDYGSDKDFNYIEIHLVVKVLILLITDRNPR